MQELIGDLFDLIGGLRVVGKAATEAEANLWLLDHQGEWDLAIVDLVLSQGSGFGVIAHAAQQPRAGTVVAFSSYASPGVRSQCLHLGADAAFDKSDTQAFITWLAQQVVTRGGAGP